MWLEDNYNCDVTKDSVAYGAISTEHSVMCSNFAVDGDEITHIKRLLTEIYPNHSISMVSDSYDYWRLVTELLPQCKDEILAHNGTLSIRGDSGNPVEILAGKNIYDIDDEEAFNADPILYFKEYAFNMGIEASTELYFKLNNTYYKVNIRFIEVDEKTFPGYTFVDEYDLTSEKIEPNAELLGTVWALDQIFGHTINSKGYKILNSKVKAIYGDSITPQRCEEIYRRLEAQGYAVNNVALGVGSFSMMCLETIDDNGTKYNPYTRDTFGIAVKATYAEDENGNPINIFKQPKALAWKKSQKGCCIVALDGMSYVDENTHFETILGSDNNLLKPVFANGLLLKEYTLDEIRKNLYPEA
jgi:nicotinamide phosphoribosyltransferase